jgi:hypothetical protein
MKSMDLMSSIKRDGYFQSVLQQNSCRECAPSFRSDASSIATRSGSVTRRTSLVTSVTFRLLNGTPRLKLAACLLSHQIYTTHTSALSIWLLSSMITASGSPRFPRVNQRSQSRSKTPPRLLAHDFLVYLNSATHILDVHYTDSGCHQPHFPLHGLLFHCKQP